MSSEIAVSRSVRMVEEAERRVESVAEGSSAFSIPIWGDNTEFGLKTSNPSPYILLKAWALLFLMLA